MGSSAKTVLRLMQLTRDGLLPIGGHICDIGATQVFGPDAEAAVAACLRFYAKRHTAATPPEQMPEGRIREIANGGFLGDLLLLCGFSYMALDIFHATNTVLFDLNVHEPGPALEQRFDLVMNLGTTEHVFNQLRAFQTLHALTKVGGVVYHDLPMAGYLNHAFFRYDPLFFSMLAQANKYDILFDQISSGASQPMPSDLQAKGFAAESYIDVGVEFVLRRTSPAPFLIHLETSTSLDVNPAFMRDGLDSMVRTPAGTCVSYGPVESLETMMFSKLTSAWLTRAVRGASRRIGFSRP